MSVIAVLAAAALELGAFCGRERRTRHLWRGEPVVTWPAGSPYRAVPSSRVIGARAPLLVRVAALTAIVHGSVVVPGVAYAMATLNFDGIALSLLPAVASAVASWCAGWLLLARARVAMDLCRLTIQASTASGTMLLLLAFVHVVAARAGWTDREATAYVHLAVAVAPAALLQAALLRATVRRHHRTFRGGPRAGYASSRPGVRAWLG